jgi:DNA-binding response OmpR family regulator
MARILLVDDEPGLRQYLRMLLEEAGYEVVEARDGIEAQQASCSRSINLLLTDLVMPNKEGIDLIQSLHKSQNGLKIIAMSGAANGKYLTMARMLGANAVLAKPFSAEKLLTTVAGLLGSSPGQ